MNLLLKFKLLRFGNEGLLKIFTQRMTHLIINELMNELDGVALHLCFNITVKGHTIVPD